MPGENNTRFPDTKTQLLGAINVVRVRDAIEGAAAAGTEINIRSFVAF